MGLRLNDGSGNHVELSSPTLTSNVNLTLPSTAGTDGQFLKVGATGNLSFDTIPPASSGPESLTVTSLPVVGSAIVNQTTSVSNVPTVVGGFPTYSIASYQWQIQGAGGTNYVDAGTSATLTIPSTINDGGTTRDTSGGKLRVRVTMQDSTPGTALTSGFITSLAVDITSLNLALKFPTTGTLLLSSTTAGGFTPIQVNGGTDNDNVVNYSFVGNSVGIGNLTVITDAGKVFQQGSSSALSSGNNGPADYDATSTYAHSGKTIAGVVSHLNNNIECVVYTDGSVKQLNGSVLHDATVAGKSPCVNYGGQGVHGSPMFILEDGSWMWGGGSTSTSTFNGTTYTWLTPVAVMPTGVKAIRCAAFLNGTGGTPWDNGHGTAGWIILGDDGYLYTADATGSAFSGSTFTNIGTMAAGGAKRLEVSGSLVTDKFVDVGPYSSVGSTWGIQGFSACRQDGQMWVSSNSTFGHWWHRYGARSNYISAFQWGGHAITYATLLNTGYAYTDTPGQIAHFVNASYTTAESVLLTPSTVSGFADPRPYPMMSNTAGGPASTAYPVFFPRS